MSDSLTLAELMHEHFNHVLSTIDRGRWGPWVLDLSATNRGNASLTHEVAGYTVTVGVDVDWIAIVAGKEWATASDIGQLIFAIRDLEYAGWLGVLSEECIDSDRLFRS